MAFQKENDLAEYYDRLYQSSIEKIKSEGCKTDDLINSPTDKRFGVTLLVRPPIGIKNKIQEFINEMKCIDQGQYYYRNSDIHITVMSIISCYEGFEIKKIAIADYIDLIEKSLHNIKNFSIKLSGITASQSSVMVQGFLSGNRLNALRNNLRTNFHNSNLEETIDKRYTIQAAHATVIRFQRQLSPKKEYLDGLEKYRNLDFGEFKVDHLELVYNDWYQRKEYVKRLHHFELHP